MAESQFLSQPRINLQINSLFHVMREWQQVENEFEEE